MATTNKRSGRKWYGRTANAEAPQVTEWKPTRRQTRLRLARAVSCARCGTH